MRRRAEQFLRDVRMLTQLDEVRQRQAGLDETRLRRAQAGFGNWSDVKNLHVSGADARYAALYAAYGIDVLALDPAEAAARMRASAIHEALLAGLDGRVQLKLWQNADQARLGRVADAADDNAWRRAFRQAALAYDWQKLKALAGQPEALEQPPGVLAWLGSMLHTGGQRSEAAAILRQAQQRHPADFWVNYNLGRVLFDAGTELHGQRHPEQALGYCRVAVAVRPSSAEAYNLLGDVLDSTGDRDGALLARQQAIACYKKAVELDPNNAENHKLVGNAFSALGSDAEAEAEFREAIRLKPDDPDAHSALAGILVQGGTRHGMEPEAEAEYREAIRLKDDRPGHLDLALLLDRQGRYREAETEYRECIRFQPDIWTDHRDLGTNLSLQKRYKEAEPEIREAIRLVQNENYADPELRRLLGDALFGQGRYKEAEAEYREGIRLKPDDPEPHAALGGFLAELGQWEEASAAFLKGTQCKVPHGRAWYFRALLALRDGDLDGYRKVCADMLLRFSKADEPDTAFWLAWTCILAPGAVADEAQAVQLAEKAVAKDPKKLSYLCMVGAALYRAGRFEEAARRLTEATALQRSPHEGPMAYTWFFLAMAQQRLGHADEARRWLDKAVQATEEALKPHAEPPGNSVEPTGAILPSWNQKLTLQLLRREAVELIQGPGTKPRK
jgi:tetratricopeptide (TPR) repeat protein